MSVATVQAEGPRRQSAALSTAPSIGLCNHKKNLRDAIHLGVGVRFPIVLMRPGSAYFAKAAALADQGKQDRHTPKTSGDGGELALGAHYGGFEGGFLAARDGQIDL